MDLLSAMRVFAHIAESGSFSATARELGLSTSSVARQMDGLEASVGVVLLTRSTRKIGLTPQGRTFLVDGRQLQQDFDTAIARVRDTEVAPTGLLRVTSAPSVGRSILPSVLESFMIAYPKIDLDLVLTDAVIDLAEGGVDVAIRVGDPAANADLVVRDLLPMRRIVCASPAYLKRHGAPGRPADLASHSCLLFRPQDEYHPWLSKSAVWTFRRRGQSETVRVTGRIYSGDADALVAAARSNNGIVLMPDWMVIDDLRVGHLRSLLNNYDAGEEDDPKTLHLAYAPRHRSAPKLTAFRDHLRTWFTEEFSDNPGL